MIVFLDTSAIFAVLDAGDAKHAATDKAWKKALSANDTIITHNYVLLEAMALVQARLGMTALTALVEDLLPVVSVRWVDEVTHKAALSALLTASRRQLSFVDCVSFQVMRDLSIKNALTLDSHFKQQGFRQY